MSEWRPIDDAARKGEWLLYFPAVGNDRYGHGHLSRMMKVGRVSDYPYRPPTLYRPIPWPEDEAK
jgi:hypothetical protein